MTDTLISKLLISRRSLLRGGVSAVLALNIPVKAKTAILLDASQPRLDLTRLKSIHYYFTTVDFPPEPSVGDIHTIGFGNRKDYVIWSGTDWRILFEDHSHVSRGDYDSRVRFL